MAILDKKLVGIYLYIPLSHFDRKLKNYKHFFGSLWTVEGFQKGKRLIDANRKKIFIALRLFQTTFKLLKVNLDIAIGLEKRFSKFHESQKYEKIQKLSHHFLVSPYINKTRILDKSILQNIKQKKVKLNIKYKRIRKTGELKKINIDNLFKFQIPIKSKTYLINRYLKHPIYKYHLYQIISKKTSNICVFRRVKYKNVNIIRFVDFIGSNKSFANLKSFLPEILKLYNAEYLDFYNYGIPKNILDKSGLIDKENKNIVIPNYFEPFVNENTDIYFGYRKFLSKGKVRIFKGDGDLDRPSILNKKIIN